MRQEDTHSMHTIGKVPKPLTENIAKQFAGMHGTAEQPSPQQDACIDASNSASSAV